MSLFTAEQLTTKTPASAFKAQIYTYLSSVGISVTSWEALNPLRTLIDVFSRIAIFIQWPLVEAIRGGFRESATGNWLITTSYEMYGVEAIEATFATGEVTATNSGGGIYDFDPEELIVKNAVTDKTYTNTEVVHIGALDIGIVIPVRATEIGAASNATIGQVTSLVTTVLGVTITNADPIVGQDAEAAADLRVRDVEAISALSPDGPAEAYSYVAKTPTLNGGVTVTRTRVLPPPGDGTLSVLVANTLGEIDPSDVALVQLGIDEWATPATATVTVSSAVAVPQAYEVTVYATTSSGLTEAEVQALVQDAIADYVNGLPIGGLELDPGVGRIPWRAVIGVAERVTVDGTEDALRPVLQASLAVEADVSLAENEVAILAPVDVVVTVNFV